jgi:kinesin family protein C1
MYKLLQEYNSSLQLYNSKLQTDLDSAHENVKRGEKEKAAIVENLSTLRGQCMSLQDQYNSCKVSFYWPSFFLLLVEVLNHFP